MKRINYIILIVIINLYQANAQWSVEHLSQPRSFSRAIGYQDKVYVAGGSLDDNLPVLSNRVDIYDNVSGTWSIDSLSSPRALVAVTAVNNKIYFAGGVTNNFETAKEIDIYDIASGTWSVDSLTGPHFNCFSVTIGNKIFFAGSSIEISVFDYTTNTWSVDSLSMSREWMAGAAVGNIALFGGGYDSTYTETSRVDIYNAATNTWDTTSLSQPRGELAAIASGGKIFFAGGDDVSQSFSNRVDIYDVANNTWSIASLSQARRNISTATIGNLVFFAGGECGNTSTLISSDVVDVYNMVTNSWTSYNMSVPHSESTATQLNNNKVFIIGGGNLLSNMYTDVVDIYTNIAANVNEETSSINTFKVFPIPVTESMQITFNLKNESTVKIDVMDITGKPITTITNKSFNAGENKIKWDSEKLSSALYIVRISTDTQSTTCKIVKF